jgi:hypothetical protein
MVQKNPAAKRNSGDDPNEIDEIREILFGVVMRSYEERFARLEQKIEDRLHMLEDDFIIRANGLEQRIKNHTEHMTKQLAQEKNGLEQWRDEINATLEQFSERLNTAKIDRQQLATLLAALATHIEQAPDAEASGSDR